MINMRAQRQFPALQLRINISKYQQLNEFCHSINVVKHNQIKCLRRGFSLSSITTVIASNVAVLTTGRSVIAGLGDEHYNFICSPFTASSIGSHFRHVIDHYRCLFDGLDCGAIDYDRRARDPLVEQHTKHALQQLDATVDALQALQTSTQPNPNLTLSVRLCAAVNSACEAPFESTLHRELVFLYGHTTHHLSLVAILMRLVDLPVDDNLGIAPSTRAYREQSQCVQ